MRGKVITSYGAKTNGKANDGINLSVPEGTPVKAAEDGVVDYSGNDVKSYGNLVLVRHSNGYVTAYAHASEVLVKRGDAIKRGQIIAKSGQSGQVGSPQLHFEIRKGSSPVDPRQFLGVKLPCPGCGAAFLCCSAERGPSLTTGNTLFVDPVRHLVEGPDVGLASTNGVD